MSKSTAHWILATIWGVSSLFWMGAMFYWVPPMNAAGTWVLVSCGSGFMCMYNMGKALGAK
jgi:hypothetical protein